MPARHPGTITVLILGDQLRFDHPALLHAESQAGRDQIRVVMIESTRRTAHLPYHRHKLILLFSAMRHFAEALRQQGYAVDYYRAATFTAALRQHLTDHAPERIVTMAAAEYAARSGQEALSERIGIPVEILPNSMFLIGEGAPIAGKRGGRLIMEDFYRAMRRHYAVLMDGKEPLGGQWNFDHDNRKRLPKTIAIPDVIRFAPDALTHTVMADLDAHPPLVGSNEGFALAVTHADAERALEDFVVNRLPYFGDYEDAMSANHALLFHSLLSPYVNIGLLHPMVMIRRAEVALEAGHAPLNAVEGFIRQILGWREYIYWQYWLQMPGLRSANAWESPRPMPAMFWDGQTEMRCVRHIVTRLQQHGYTHHIERLMVVCNFCLLAGVDPAAVADWFLTFYIDAYDWVVLPNVIGMGLNADGGRTATKPYIASASYIESMSDYCKACRFDHKARSGPEACPFNVLYWNFLITHEERLRANPRAGKNVLALRHLDAAERAAVQQQARALLDDLPYYSEG